MRKSKILIQPATFAIPALHKMKSTDVVSICVQWSKMGTFLLMKAIHIHQRFCSKAPYRQNALFRTRVTVVYQPESFKVLNPMKTGASTKIFMASDIFFNKELHFYS